MRRLFLFALLIVASGCDGALVSDDGVSVQIASDGLVIANERAEPIYIATFGEWALIFVDPMPQTAENPGLEIAAGAQAEVPFEDDGLVRRDDDRYAVSWITVENGEIGASGFLDVRR